MRRKSATSREREVVIVEASPFANPAFVGYDLAGAGELLRGDLVSRSESGPL